MRNHVNFEDIASFIDYNLNYPFFRKFRGNTAGKPQNNQLDKNKEEKNSKIF